MDPFIGEIQAFAGDYAPQGWAFCDGQLLPIRSNTTLFSLLGTQFGGDGANTFALPDLRGRVPMGVGQGGSLSPRDVGETPGTERETLTQRQMPPHTHPVTSASSRTTNRPANGVPAPGGAYGPAAGGGFAASGAVQFAGGGQAHENRPPTLAISWIIAVTTGIYPSRP